MSPDELLDIVEDLIPEDDTVRLGTIVTVLDGGASATVRFDGESSSSAKPRKCVSYTAAVGERVVLLRVGHSWVIVGQVGSLGGIESNTPSTIVKRNSGGDIHVRLLRPEYDWPNNTPNYIMTQVEVGPAPANNYVRPATPSVVGAAIGIHRLSFQPATLRPDQYPDGITHQRVGGNDGFPESYGTCITVCSDSARAGQTFYSSTGSVWHRSHLDSITWGDWVPVKAAGFSAAGIAWGPGWSNYSATWPPLSVQQVPGGVQVKGLIKSDGTSTTVARLAPEHRRQNVHHMFNQWASGPLGITAHRVNINDVGQFYVSASGTYSYLSMELFVPFDF